MSTCAFLRRAFLSRRLEHFYGGSTVRQPLRPGTLHIQNSLGCVATSSLRMPNHHSQLIHAHEFKCEPLRQLVRVRKGGSSPHSNPWTSTSCFPASHQNAIVRFLRRRPSHRSITVLGDPSEQPATVTCKTHWARPRTGPSPHLPLITTPRSSIVGGMKNTP